jgi:hypothetical protein
MAAAAAAAMAAELAAASAIRMLMTASIPEKTEAAEATPSKLPQSLHQWQQDEELCF